MAANLINAEAILEQWPGVLADIAAALAPGRLFVSVVESGSTDGTRAALRALSAALDAVGVRHRLATGDDSGGWRGICAELLAGDGVSRAVCEAADCGTAGRLRDCNAKVRIAVMAALRNRALAPLLDAGGGGDGGGSGDGDGGSRVAGEDAPHLDLPGRVTVLFLNDVLLYAEDVLELLATGGGGYDLACGMDFEGVKLYDTWVLRDLSGVAASDWYPFFREAGARAALSAGAPARVYSCWNGAVALPAAAFLRDGIRFRSWAEGEPRSTAVGAGAAAAGTFGATCAVSECALLAKDMWARAGAHGARVYVNPRVRLAYNAATELWQRTLMRALNALLLSWSNRLGAAHHSLRAAVIRTPLGSAVAADARNWPPVIPACGLADEWGPW